jgi:hypothetical protein
MGGTCRAHEVMRNAYKILFGNLEEREHSENLGVDGRIILK